MFTIVVYCLLIVIALYLLAGVVFTIFFQAKGLSCIDEGTHGSSLGFRVIIIPGCIVFWIVLLRKWMNIKAKNRAKANKEKRLL
ncbi:hypothetical protein I5907_18575 [Panacibacter sp. DH6]|uniref:Uncharacterized protein n=1 Tax=Panacibacter microcysteis TaxID=2793269 RepID=A0A931GZJ0_9BACT|nr:hypothetical protein [Panacibacter microcysteis]MBG9378251.1 hypothetical protein [Panacibacter microcysteis]